MPRNANNPSQSQETDGAEKVLAEVTQQTVQTSHTLALHIKQHDEIEEIAQQRANTILVKVTEDLDQAYQAALKETSEQNQRVIDQALAKIEEDCKRLQTTYETELATAVKTLNEEKASNQHQYELLCSQTNEALKVALNEAVKRHVDNTNTAMEANRLQMKKDYEDQTNTAVLAVYDKSRKTARILMAATGAGAILAITISALIAMLACQQRC